MNLKQVVVNNGGMSQDLSISKQDNKFAFENKNIRIQSTDDGTLLSVTNIKGPTPTKTILGCNRVLGSCVTPDYLVIFGINAKRVGSFLRPFSIIYRIDLNEVDSAENACKILYDQQNIGDGALNLDVSSFIDTLYYEEGEYVKKVYWTDGKNNPRVINLVTPGERVPEGKVFTPYETNVFEFYPNIYADKKIPEVIVTKNRNVVSQLPSGVVQYFISYYSVNGAETLIANSSDLYTIDYSNRGAKADEVGVCAFDIEIPASNVNINFDYIRVYSAIRTTYDGPLTVKIVGDIKITKDTEWAQDGIYKITDTGINQEQLQDNYIYFIGGTPFIAKTISEKDGTVFFGDIVVKNINISNSLKNLITETCIENESGEGHVNHFVKDGILKFNLSKKIDNNASVFNSSYYKYNLQLDKGSKNYKTFKSGEIYRFGIQFQTKTGQWTDVVWIGDLECTERPKYDAVSNVFIVNDVEFTMPNEIRTAARNAGYENYRILIADSENTNGRKVITQGILCPTMFTPTQRYLNSPYSLPSWVMRPRRGEAAYHHFEPLFDSSEPAGELASYFPKLDNDGKYTKPFYPVETDVVSEKETFLCQLSFMAISDGHRSAVKSILFRTSDLNSDFYDEAGNAVIHGATELTPGNITVLYDEYLNSTRWSEVVNNWTGAYTENDIDTRGIPSADTLSQVAKAVFLEKFMLAITLLIPGLGGLIASIYSITQGGASLSNVSLSLLSLVLPDMGWLGLQLAVDVDSETGLDYGTVRNAIYNSDEYKALSPYQKDLIATGWIPLGRKNLLGGFFTDTKTTIDINNPDASLAYKCWSYPICLKPTGFDDMDGKAQCYVQVRVFDGRSFEEERLHKEKDDYYIDESIVTLNSPDIDNNPAIVNNKDLKFRVIGSAPLSSNYSDLEVQTETSPYIFDGGLEHSTVQNHRISIDSTDSINPLYSDYLYWDAAWLNNALGNESILNSITLDSALYKMFMWDFSGSIIGANSDTYSGVDSDNNPILLKSIPSVLKTKTFYNHLFSSATEYFNPSNDVKYEDISTIKSYNEDANTVNIGTSEFQLYYGDYDSLITKSPVPTYHKMDTNVFYHPYGTDAGETYTRAGSVRLKFSSTPHAIFSLSKSVDYRKILPEFTVNDEEYYRGIISGKYNVGEGWESEVPFEDLVPDSNSIDSTLNFYLIYQYNGNDDCIVKIGANPDVVCTGQENLIGEIINVPEFSTTDANNNGHWSASDFNAKDAIEAEIRNRALAYIEELGKNRTDDYECEITELLLWMHDTQQPYVDLNKGYCTVSITLKTRNSQFWASWLTPESVHNCGKYFTELYIPTQSSESTVKTIIKNYFNYRIIDDYTFFNYLRNGKVVLAINSIDSDTLQVLNGLTKYSGIISAWGNIVRSDYPGNRISSYSKHLATADLMYISSEKYNIENIVLGGTGAANDPLYIQDFDLVVNPIKDEIYVYEGVQTNRRFKWINSTCTSGKRPYYGFPITYVQPHISETENYPGNPYLFIGELYQDIEDKDLYGGVDDVALRRLTWLPASKIVPLAEDIDTMEGDTYYQRWDCLKTYPTTEEDENKVVDIVSFMVETHKNLDDRTDSNRASFNLMSRPSGFNLFNSVYNQPNNILTYTTNWNDLTSEHIPNQIVWSMAKNYLGDVDSWTNTNVTSSTRVKYPVTKLVNFNNNILALTEHSLELVNFNSKQLVPSTDNTFIELQNSTKVNGTTRLQYPYGTHNMSTIITEQGLYFIEDNEKSLIRLGGEEGITKVGITEMLEWFHRNIVQGTYVSANQSPFRLEYDPIHKDLYIVNNEYQIVYNENLKAFTSFVTYSGEYWLYNYNGKLYAYNFDSHNHSLGVFEMFSNEKYNIDFPKIDWNSESGEWEVLEPEVLDYSVWYRINPNPYSDKVFTNGIIMADLGTIGTDVKMPNSSKSLNPPFEYVRAWTEYQDTGYVKLEHILDKPSTLKQKFRYWRFNIPRDTNSPMKRDRIRNPWIHIQMTGNSTEKMEFHNLAIQYME